MKIILAWNGVKKDMIIVIIVKAYSTFYVGLSSLFRAYLPQSSHIIKTETERIQIHNVDLTTSKDEAIQKPMIQVVIPIKSIEKQK
jgi:hypothetical protein